MMVVPIDEVILEPIDPGPSSRAWTAVLWAALIAVVAGIMWLQSYRQQAPLAVAAPAAPPNLMLRMLGRYTIGADRSGLVQEHEMRRMLQQVEQMAATPADQLRLAVLDAEVIGVEEALARLHVMRARPISPWLEDDADALVTLYTRGAESLDAQQRVDLLDRHLWFGKLALSHGQSESSPLRREVLAACQRTLLAVIGALILAGMVLVVGIVLGIVAIVMAASGTIRGSFAMTPEASRSRNPLLETALLFLVGMVVLWVVSGWLQSRTGADPSWVLMWLLPLVLLWPRIRGVDGREWREALGLHAGKGVVSEVACGAVGYIAGLPVVATGIFISFVLILLSQADAAHPIVEDTPLDGGAPGVLALYLLACVWAPVFEELTFRGALYSHVRGYVGALASALIVGAIFAAIHPQGWAAIPALTSIAVVLALLREWRGSIIAPMVGHAMNNGFVVTLLVLSAW